VLYWSVPFCFTRLLLSDSETTAFRPRRNPSPPPYAPELPRQPVRDRKKSAAAAPKEFVVVRKRTRRGMLIEFKIAKERSLIWCHDDGPINPLAVLCRSFCRSAV
jgi:hypothetical protein